MCILMAAIFKHPIGPPLVSAIVIQISELGSLVSKTPEKWSFCYSMTICWPEM